MGGDELAGTLSFLRCTKHAYPVAIQVIDRDPVAQSRRIVNTAHAIQFADIDVLLPQHHGIGPVDIVPHGYEVAFSVENLYAVSLPVHHVNPVVAVDSDVVGTDELSGVNAGAAPGKFVIPAAGIYVDAGVAVSIRDIQVAIAGHDCG